jgi:signal transduction histidine kinase/ActR/RegA family two-component response regulator
VRAARTWRLVAPGAIVLVAILAVVAVALLSAQSSARRAVESGFAERAKVSAALTSSIFKSVSTMDTSSETRLFGTRRVSDATLSGAAKGGNLVNLLLLAPDGSIIAASTNTSAALTRTLKAHPRYIADALRGQAFAVTDVILPSAQMPLIEIARPLSTPYGRRVLVSGFALTVLSGFIGDYLAGSASAATTHAYVIDDRGRLIATSATPNAPVHGFVNLALLTAISRAASGSFGHGEYFTVSTVKNTSWRVVVTGSQRVVFAAVNGGSRWLPWVLFAAFASVLGLVLVLVARLVHGATKQRTTDTRLRAQAEEANRAKSEFLSRMSHELRTPLNAVVGFGQLLELDDLEPSQRESVEQILKAGRHLLGLINEVLDISRIESGTMSMSLEPVHLGSVLADVLSLIRPLADKAGVRLTLDPADLAEVYVHADRHRLTQVLVNVLSNAVKYNHAGGEVSGSYEEPLPGRVALLIADTGEGIAADKLDRLFEPFNRLGAERTDVEGTGLGLALSMHLMQAMGGTIKAESSSGDGTTMRLELARTEPAQTEPEIAEPVAAAANGSHHATVVYIEDNPSNLRLVERALERLPGVRLVSAIQGGIGLDLVREHHPDLVLLDLHLPDLSGAEVLDRLNGDPATASIPVVVVSADATPSQIERLQEAGAAAYMTKPIDVRLLLETVNRYVTATANR